MSTPGSAMTAMTVIANPLRWDTNNKEVLLFYLTNCGQHYVQKRNQTTDDSDPKDTPTQPAGPLASPSQFASLQYQNLVEVYGMVEHTTTTTSGTCACSGCTSSSCNCANTSSTTTTVYQPYAISPVYRPLLTSSEETKGTDQLALAACGDGDKNGWVYYVRTKNKGDPQIHEITLSWEASTAIIKSKQNPLPGTMLAACYLGGDDDRWVFYIAEDTDEESGSESGSEAQTLFLFFFQPNNSNVGGKIASTSNLLRDTPLTACVIPSKDSSDTQMICLYYVSSGGYLERLEHLMSDTSDTWTLISMNVKGFATNYAQMSCVVDSDNKQIRLYYKNDSDSSGWSVYVDKWYH